MQRVTIKSYCKPTSETHHIISGKIMLKPPGDFVSISEQSTRV